MIDLIIYISQLLKKIIVSVGGVLSKDFKHIKKLVAWVNNKLSKKTGRFFIISFLLINLTEHAFISFVQHEALIYRNFDIGLKLFFASFLASSLSPEIVSPNITAIYNLKIMGLDFGCYFSLLLFLIIYLLANYSLLKWMSKKDDQGAVIASNKKIITISFIMLISWIFSTLPFFL